ncbi:MAG: MBL fold metallo-hydrolase, partial [Patescibacteria group bacterium]|nr:MBL fold metallo-hydrolase [Patescibacteria group bacterium]
ALTVQPIASSSAGNAVLLRDGSSKLLLDCGVAWSEVLQAVENESYLISAVCLTHHHGDHARGIVGASRSCVTVLTTPPVAELAGLVGYRYLRPMRPGVIVDARGWQVQSFDAYHDGAPGACGFVVDAPGGDRAVYVVDTAMVHERFAGVTHWLVEANYDSGRLGGLDPSQRRHIVEGHMSIDNCIALLKANNLLAAREIWLLHLSDRHSDEAEFVRRVEAATGVPTYAAPRRAIGVARR